MCTDELNIAGGFASSKQVLMLQGMSMLMLQGMSILQGRCSGSTSQQC